MRLYRITFEHFAPRDSEDGIKSLVIAKDDEAVFEHVSTCYAGWGDDIYVNSDPTKFKEPQDEWEEVGEVLRNRLIEERGDYWDDSGFEDVYYGVTRFGWSEGEEISDWDAQSLVRLGIATMLGNTSSRELSQVKLPAA